MSDGTPESDWSAADAAGICTQRLDVGAKSTLRGKRKRRSFRLQPQALKLWPGSQQLLLKQWLKGASASRRWPALLKIAGSNRFNEANELLQRLLEAGWVQIEERRNRGLWEVTLVEFLDLEHLRERMGLKNRDKLNAQKQKLDKGQFSDAQLESLRQDLANMPAERALKRHGLLQALAAWQQQQKFGSRRDFSQFARGSTKAISGSEWNWLTDAIDLEEWKIGRHTATLYLQGSFILHFAAGQLDLGVVPDFIALTPATLTALQSISVPPERWLVVENQTCFEKVARQAKPHEAVLWVPGYPPGWWQEAVARLVSLCPAPAQIACDPDPAGIQIALTVGRLWQQNNCHWTPWKMGEEELKQLKHDLPVSAKDRLLLRGLRKQSLPLGLAKLAAAIEAQGIKGEQEELFY